MARYRTVRWWAGGLVAAAAWPGGVTAQTTLPEIVVRAPSPIVRRAPAPARPPSPSTTRAPTAPTPPPEAAPIAPAPALGVLPVVTDQFATVTVMPSQEIERTPGAQLGDLLFSKPGVTGSSFAPGASRPIVRGLDAYRVRIQENGLATNDMSEIGEDHGVAMDPLAAKQVEVIRGPATLRYGSQAIGGVVNASNDRIPEAIPAGGFSAVSKGAASSVDNGLEGAVLLDAGKGNWAVHADAFGRRADDYRIPSYPYLFPPSPAPAENGRQPNSFVRSDGQSIGGSYVFDQGLAGLAVTRFASLYGIPGAEAAASHTRIDLEQVKLTGKGEFRPESSPIDSIRYWFGLTDYKHDERGIGGADNTDGVRQTFTNRAQEARVETQLMPFDLRFAALTTAVGVQASHQHLTAPGDAGDINGLFDPNHTTAVAAFVFNEFKFDHGWRAQLAGRVEQNSVTGSTPDLFVDPDLAIKRDLAFTPKSGAVGVLKDLPWDLVASATAQYVERAPRAPELLSRGPHDATGTFDIGNPNLNLEVAKSVEVGLRRATGPFRFEATAFYTRFDGFIFRRLTGVTCGADFASCGVETELKQAVYSQKDAVFRGFEYQSQLDIAPLWNGTWGIENRFDVVRATFTDGTNVPRIPPLRAGGGVFWRDANWLARVSLLHAFAHTQIADHETPTPGYNLLKAELSYTRKLPRTPYGAQELTVGVVGDNLLNADIR
ncbi:MAG TPA: TonB-dependent receptor, partial [Xanthobacteraceae bacterium]